MYVTVYGIKRAIEDMAKQECLGCVAISCIALPQNDQIVRSVCPHCEQILLTRSIHRRDWRRDDDGLSLTEARCPFGRKIYFKIDTKIPHKRCKPVGKVWDE